MKRKVTGTVLSTKMQKTAVIGVETTILNRKYNKQLKRIRKYYADNTINAAEGNVVIIEECPAISKMKRWKVVEVVK